MKIFIIDWTKEPTTEIIEQCRKAGHEVDFELEDGGLAYKKILLFMPEIILVNYAVKPLHGRITAQEVRKRKSTSNIPFYFINGTDKDNKKITVEAECITLEQARMMIDVL